MSENESQPAAKPSELSALLGERIEKNLRYLDHWVKNYDFGRPSVHSESAAIIRALLGEVQEAMFQRDLARTDASEEARCADELHKDLNKAATEVKALRLGIARVVEQMELATGPAMVRQAYEMLRQLVADSVPTGNAKDVTGCDV